MKITDEIAIYKAKADEIVNNKYEMPDKCIFVDDYTGACRIYEVRPLVCRLYGVVKTDDNVCEQIKNNQHIYDTLLTSSSINIAHNTFSFDNGIMTTPKSKAVRTRRTAFLYIQIQTKKGNQYEKQIQKADKLAFGKHYDVGSTSYSDISG